MPRHTRVRSDPRVSRAVALFAIIVSFHHSPCSFPIAIWVSWASCRLASPRLPGLAKHDPEKTKNKTQTKQQNKLTPWDYQIKSKGFYQRRDGKSPLFVDYRIISPGWYEDAQGKHTSVTVDFQIPKWCCKVCACLIIFYARLCNTKCMLQQSVS